MRQEGAAAPSHEGSGNSREGSRTSCCFFPESAILGGAGIAALLLPHYYLIPLLHLGIATPEPTLFPRGLYLDRGLMLFGKQKEHQRHFLCSVLEGSDGASPDLGDQARSQPQDKACPLWGQISPRDTADSPHPASATISHRSP